jgi:hypothetical protein
MFARMEQEQVALQIQEAVEMAVRVPKIKGEETTAAAAQLRQEHEAQVQEPV